jgi:tryptophanyl-tRNA synthetase
MSLRDASSKMSKSDPSDASRINLDDSADKIFEKIKRAKTDSVTGISFDPEARPEVSNLVNLYSEFTSLPVEQVVERFENKDTVTFKRELADVLIGTLDPIRARIEELQSDPAHVVNVLKEGAAQAEKIAEENLNEIKQIVGLNTF